MFTGIAHGKFSVRIDGNWDSVTSLALDLGEFGETIEVGASVAISGVCLTVVDADAGSIRVEVVPETARISNLSSLKTGDFVNVERSFRVGQEVGGHLLSGHVADVAKVTRVTKHASETQLEFYTPEEWRLYSDAERICSSEWVQFDIG